MELAFGARLPGSTHLQLQKLNPATTRTTEQPATTSNKRGCHYHGAPPVLLRANLRALASPTRTYSPQVARPPAPGGGYSPHKTDGHSLRLATSPRFKIGCHPPTRIRLPPTRTRIRPGMPKLTALLARHVPINSTRTRSHTAMTTPQFHRVPSQDTHTKPPASTDRDTVSRPLGSGDQTDLSTKAATRPTVWGALPT